MKVKHAVAAGLLWLTGASPTAALDVTARDVTEAFFKSDAAHPADFSGRKLEQLDLSGLDFKGARLAGANLYGSDLTTANLARTDLAGAKLDRATLIKADFTRADLSGATILRPTVFSTLDNDRRDAPRFAGANLSAARIVASRLDGVDFRGANLTRVVLGPQDHGWGEERYAQRTVMIGCDFTGATLIEANLSNSVLLFAVFRDADLTGAQLQHADLSKADLTGADLTGADLTGANLEDANLSQVRGLATVVGLATIFNLDKAIR
jgi:uncharacterized protein YjbI with pentapeptide repeats